MKIYALYLVLVAAGLWLYRISRNRFLVAVFIAALPAFLWFVSEPAWPFDDLPERVFAGADPAFHSVGVVAVIPGAAFFRNPNPVLSIFARLFISHYFFGGILLLFLCLAARYRRRSTVSSKENGPQEAL